MSNSDNEIPVPNEKELTPNSEPAMTPVQKMGEAIANKLPRKVPSLSTQMRLSGLEALKVRT